MNNCHYLQGDWTPCYCAPELYNKSSIRRNIDNWNTKTTEINTITFSITFQVKIHQIQIYSKQKLSKTDLISYYTNTWLSAEPISSAFISNSNWRGNYFVNYLKIDQWTLCYCAPELYNKSSILRNIDNWNTKTNNINTITFSITFNSKYIIFRDI